MDEQRVAVLLADEHHLLVDLLDGRRLGGYRNLDGVCHQLARELHYYLYPPQYDLRFVGGLDKRSFRDAIAASRKDLLLRLVALARADMLPVFGGGRGDSLTAAAEAYRKFLLELARGEKSDEELADLLDEADILLNIAYEKADPV